MDIIDEFEILIDKGNFKDALPLIEEILKRNEAIPTSWFNYGVCLSGLEQYQKAGKAFLKAYELDSDDGGALYRGCLSFAHAKDSDMLYEVFLKECERDPSMIEDFLEEKAFSEFFKEARYQDLVKSYSRKKPRWKFW